MIWAVLLLGLLGFQEDDREGLEFELEQLNFEAESLEETRIEVARRLAELATGEERIYYLETVSRAAAAIDSDDQAALYEWYVAKEQRDLQQWLSALDRVNAAILRFPDAGTMFPYFYQLRAELQRNLGDHEAALASLEQAVQAAGGHDRFEAIRLGGLGQQAQIYLELGLPDRARPLVEAGLEQAATLRRQGLRRASSIAAAHLYAVNYALAVKDYEGAIAKVGEFLSDEELYDQVPQVRGQLRAKRAISHFYLARAVAKDRRGAEGHLRAVLADELTLPGDQVKCGILLADLLLREDRWEEAKSQLDQSLAKFPQPALASVNPNAARWVTGKARWALQTNQDSDTLCECWEQCRFQMEGMLEQWHTAARREAGIGFLHYSYRRELVAAMIGLRERLATPNGDKGSLLELLWDCQRHSSLQASLETPETVSLEEIRRWLVPVHGALLVYVVASPTSYCVVVTDADLRAVPMASNYEIELARDRYRDHLAKFWSPEPRDQERERVLAKALADQLLPASVQTLIADKSSLTIVGMDLLGAVPFAWLPTSHGPYLGTRCALTSMPSLPVGIALARRSSESSVDPGNAKVAILGNIQPSPAAFAIDPSLRALPWPYSWQTEIDQLYESCGVEFFLAEDATGKELSRQSWPDQSLLQFVTHGLNDYTRARPFGLLITETATSAGLLWCSDVEAMSAPRITLLTACRSASGPLRRGDAHAADMAGAWIKAGSNAVLVSATDLPYESTLEVSRDLHRQLSDGKSVAESLKFAREQFVDRQGPLAPFRFGQLEVVGYGEQRLTFPESRAESPDVAPSSPTLETTFAMGAISGALLVVLGAGIWRRVRRPA